jgi:hypothetical protein
MIYRHPITGLRESLLRYMLEKGELWILIDNLDKGWSSTGLQPDDVHIVRGLLDAANKLQRSMLRRAVPCSVIICLRKDVFERLIENTPDSGKISRGDVDWTDREALKQLLALRLEAAGLGKGLSFDEMWLRICCNDIGHQPSSDYIVERCLMRPRALLGYIIACRNRTVNRGDERIEAEDLMDGVKDYSRDLLH